MIPGADVIVHADPGKKASSKAEPKDRISDIMKEHRDLFIGYHALTIVHHKDISLPLSIIKVDEDDLLPCSQCKPSLDERNGEARFHQGCPHVGETITI